MFSDELLNVSWNETAARIRDKSAADVRRALAKTHRNIDDFEALISPAAAPFIEQMAHLSRRYTEARFGKTVSMFIPIYIANSCTNSCVYCGFHAENPMKRTVLNDAQIIREFKAIKKIAPFESILILTGEDRRRSGVPYIARALDLAKPFFSNVKIEVMPLRTRDYTELREHHGLNGVICFQETYHRENYRKYHPRGMKSDFEWRVNGFDRMGQAGLHSIGLGVLIGLEKEWQTDIAMMARHLRYLQKKYPRTKYSISFPRMRPSENGGFRPNVVMTDAELAQTVFAMRIFDPDVDISFSTRERAEMRDAMATLGVTTMSAASRTDPGGYSKAADGLEQFRIDDARSADDVAAALRAHGREPVWKDWDAVFDRSRVVADGNADAAASGGTAVAGTVA